MSGPGEDPSIIGGHNIYKPATSLRKRGLLIAGEGLDGCGKTSVMRGLRDHLIGRGRTVVVSNWNDTTEIYNLMMRLNVSGDLSKEMRCVFSSVELAARYHYVIRPALDAGSVVLVNKYVVSALAHSIVRGHDVSFLHRLYDYVINPDLTIYIDVSPQVALDRKLRSGGLGFWEAGLDLALDMSLEEALRRYEAGALDVEFVSRSFVEFQTQLARLHRELLADWTVLTMDGSSSVDDLVRCASSAVVTLLQSGGSVSDNPTNGSISRMNERKNNAPGKSTS